MNKRARADQYTLKAKKLGYPARSVFKLEEIQHKTSVIRKKMPVLDLGAAPGSWTLYTLRLLGPGGTVRAVDLSPLEIKVANERNLEFWQGDMTSSKAHDFILQGAPYGCIMSDAAPKTTGNSLVDTARSYELAVCVIDLAEAHLIKSGNMVVKIFQGGDEKKALDRIGSLFANARIFRPKSVRSNSIETYLIGKGFLGSGPL